MDLKTTVLYAALSRTDFFRLAVYAMLALVVMLSFVTTRPPTKGRKPSLTPTVRPRGVRRRLLQRHLDRLQLRIARLSPESPESLFCAGHLTAARQYIATGEFGAAYWSALAVARKLRRLR